MDNAKKRRMNRLIGKINVMRSVLAQLSMIVSVSLLLTACPSNEGAKAVSDPVDFFAGPLPQGLPVFIEINEPYWAHDHLSHDPSNTEDEDSLSLYSVALPEDGEVAKAPVAILSVSSDQVTSLNTVPDENDRARTEISILVNAGNVYKVDHQKGADNSGSIRLLNHFVNKICEIIPVDVVQTTSIGNDVTHTVLHSDKIIYVVTVEGAVTASDCANASSSKKRFYELPLNFQFNANDDDESKTNELKPPVSESLARGKLMFGWVDDETTDTTTNSEDQRLTYGYLGYSITENKLRFYDSDRVESWCQPRGLQIFDIEEISPGKYSPEYLFQLTELEQYQYQLQMGLDVYVFDSTAEIFSKPLNVSYCEFGSLPGDKSSSDIIIEGILTDRIFKTGITLAGNTGIAETVKSVVALSDEDEVVIVDDSSVYRYNYLASYDIPVTSRNFNVEQQAPVSIDNMASQSSAYPFSQFDLKGCTKNSNISECNAAHDLEANEWQFITGCDANKGCSLAVNTSEFCATAEELLADPNAGSLCSVLDYRHLDELNNPDNDAGFRGFMQYDREFINSLGYTLHGNSLFITARMYEKEILLRYVYNKELSSVKPEREIILFGERKNHFGLDVYINENNLFATVLWEKQKRENECYKNYQQVECDLGNTLKGQVGTCTAKDLDDGECFNGFQEYESVALFCSAAELNDGSCSDETIITTNDLVVNGVGESGKWLKMLDLDSGNSPKDVIYLLSDDKGSVLDEGVLTDPFLYEVNNIDGEPSTENMLGQLSGKVEAVRSGWVSNDNLAQFDVITEEVELLDQVVTEVNSVSNIYLVTDPKLPNSATPSDANDGVNKQIINIGEVTFPRLITQLNSNEE